MQENEDKDCRKTIIEARKNDRQIRIAEKNDKEENIWIKSSLVKFVIGGSKKTIQGLQKRFKDDDG